MSVLDNRSNIKQLDPTNYLSHLTEVPEQLFDGYAQAEEVKLPALYMQAKQVLFLVSTDMLPVACGLRELALMYARVPIIVSTDYKIPHWVSKETLVVALDYHGASEQILVAFREASILTSRLVAISISGELAREARRVRAPHVSLSYGAPPHVAFYYTLSVATHLFRKLDLIEIRETTVNEAAVLARSLFQNIGPDVPLFQNSAKQLAEKIAQRRTFIIGSGPLVATAKKWELTLAAVGKTSLTATTLAEFNDTIINSMRPAAKPQESPLLIMLQSKYDHPRNKVQQTLTYQVAQAQKIVYEQIFMHPSGSLFGEMVLSSFLGDCVSFYLSILRQSDPSRLEATHYIHGQLAQTSPFDS